MQEGIIYLAVVLIGLVIMLGYIKSNSIQKQLTEMKGQVEYAKDLIQKQQNQISQQKELMESYKELAKANNVRKG